MMDNLSEKISREKANYDTGSVRVESYKLHSRFQHVFECPNARRAEHYIDQVMSGCVNGKDLLDFGCYDGGMAPRYAALNPRNIDAHSLSFPDEAFDIVIGRAILHHLEFEIAVNEIRRVLRPGGSAIFVEPLGDNPAAKLIRLLTPKARTLDEAPLTKSQIEWADSLFGSNAHIFLNLLSVPVAMLTSQFPMSADNATLRLADSADLFLGRTKLKYWMRQVVLVWHKMEQEERC